MTYFDERKYSLNLTCYTLCLYGILQTSIMNMYTEYKTKVCRKIERINERG